MDRDKLKAWMETRPKSDAICLVERYLLRVALISSVNAEIKFGRRPVDNFLQILRFLISLRVASKFISSEVTAAVNAARAASEPIDFYSAFVAADALVETISGDHVRHAMSSLAFSRHAWSRGLGRETSSQMVENILAASIDSDVNQRMRGLDLSSVALWNDNDPVWVRIPEAQLIKAVTEETGIPNSFWHRWWQSRIDGTNPFPDDLLRDIALIPNAIWTQGPRAVHVEIEKIEAQYLGKQQTLDDVLHAMPAAKAEARAAFAQTVWTYREQLPPTLDAVLGYCSLEIERLQQKNYRDDQEAEDCSHQIKVLTRLHEAISRLAPMIQTTERLTEAEAVVPEKLSRLALRALKDWPRKNMDDLVDSGFRFALVGAATPALVMMGVPANWAIACTTTLFGGKKIADAVKASSDSKGLLGS